MRRVMRKPDRGTHTMVTRRDTMSARKDIHRMGLLAGPPGFPPMLTLAPVWMHLSIMGSPMPAMMLNMGPAYAPATAICAKPSRAMEMEAAKSFTELLRGAVECVCGVRGGGEERGNRMRVREPFEWRGA